MDWSVWRQEFPITGERVHLNHAGVAPLSRRVAAAITRFADEALHLSPAIYKEWDVRCEAARAAYARLIGARSDEIAFVKNTSEGISLVAAGLPWRDGDNVIAVDGDFPSNIYPWWALRGRGVETRLVAAQGRIRVDEVAAAMDARTKVLAVSFVDWSSGARNDLAALGSLCRERHVLFCVDGIQGVGALALDVEAFGIDTLAVGGHKWLLAPEGCGALYVARRIIDRIDSVLHGWKSVRGADAYLPYHFEPRPDAAKLEPGSPPQLATHAFGAAVDLLLEIGIPAIEQRILELNDELAHRLHEIGAELLSPTDRAERSGILVFRHGQDVAALTNALNQNGFIVRSRGGGVRVAPHFYTSQEDLDRLVRFVRDRRA